MKPLQRPQPLDTIKILLILMLSLLPSILLAANSTNYIQDSGSFNNGGNADVSQSTNYANTSTIGQATIGLSSSSNYANAAGFFSILSSQEPSNQPTGITATVDSSSQITITWTDTTTDKLADSYLILCSTTDNFTDPSDGTPQSDDSDCSNGSRIKNIARNTGTAIWSGLTVSTQYFFKIYPYTNTGNFINYKTDGTPLTGNATTTSLTKTTPTNHPTNISVSTNGSGTLTTTWTEPTTGTLPDGYLIVCSTTTITAPTNGISPSEDNDCSTGSGVQHITAGSTSTTWANLDANTNYQFKIYPYSNSGTSIDYKTDEIPQELAVTESALTPEISIQNIQSSAVVLAIESGDTSPRSDDDTDFGTTLDTSTTTITKTFRISNTGQAPLTLSASPAISLSGLDTTLATPIFSIATQPANNSIAVGASEDFSIAYIPATGISTATVVIANNDSDENPYIFNIQGGESANPIAPRIEKLRAFLNSDDDKAPLSLFSTAGGNIQFAFELVDSDGGTYGYVWASSNGDLSTLLNGINQTLNNGTVTSGEIAISGLAAGKYPMTITVSDSTFNTSYETKLSFLLEITGENIVASDYKDTDGDGIRDSLDKKPNTANSVSTRLSESDAATDKDDTADKYVSKVPLGYRVVLGSTAKAAQKTGLKIAESELQQFGDDGASAEGTSLSSKTLDHTFDYAIEGVAIPSDISDNTKGNSIAIVMPLESPLKADSTFHKYNANNSPEWSDFSLDAKNTIEWANFSSDGICPDPDESIDPTAGNYVNNVSQTDKSCLQITIQDGGANDEDGAINGTIVDPFGIATPTVTTTTSSGGGSSNACSSFGSSTSSTPKEGTSNCNFVNYFTLTLEPALEIDATVDYQTRDGSAKAGEDYIATSGTVTMKAGQTELLIPVTIIADNLIEDDESFELVLTNPTGATFPVGITEIVTTHTILNSDSSYITFPDNVTAQKLTTEGSSNHVNYFQLALDKAYDHDIIVSYHTQAGTATAGEDYIATSRKVKIRAGQTKVMIGVTIIADTIKEEDETFSLVISNPIGEGFPAGVTEITATHTILDDD